MRKILLLLSIFSLILFSCSSDDEDIKYTWSIYSLTKCDDVNGNNINSEIQDEQIELTESNANNYISNLLDKYKDIEIIKDETKLDGDEKRRSVSFKNFDLSSMDESYAYDYFVVDIQIMLKKRN